MVQLLTVQLVRRRIRESDTNILFTEKILQRRQSTLLTKTTAEQSEVALSYHRVRGLCFLAVVFATTIHENINTRSARVSNVVVIADVDNKCTLKRRLTIITFRFPAQFMIYNNQQKSENKL